MSKLEEVLRGIVREELCNALVHPPSGKEWSESQRDIYRAVALIPYGRVASYGTIAAQTGRKRTAGQYVGQELMKLEYDCRYVPWWRVVKADGSLADTEQLEERRHLMELEGIKFYDGGAVRQRFFWPPSASAANE